MKIILASKSPRRKELLKMLNLQFECIVGGEDENVVGEPKDQPRLLAMKKAREVLNQTSGDRVVIGSDTLVFLKDKVLGKPKDEAEAAAMLKSLSGKCNEVINGICVIVSRDGVVEEHTAETLSKVYFKKLTETQIDDYIKTKHPLDKAGAYGIQGEGAKFIKKVEGDFYAVMGISVSKLYDILQKINIL